MSELRAPLAANIDPSKLEEMQKVANQLSSPGKGILASDEITAGLGRKFALIGLENTFENRRKWRQLLYSTPGVNRFLSGIIFNPETFNEFRMNGTGQHLRDFVNAQGILVGIKVDFGLRPLPYKEGNTFTVGIDGLLQRAAEFYKNGARFTKARVLFRIQNGLISPTTITENAHWSAKYALICQAAGLVPIIEPEILMDGDHSIAISKYWTNKILNKMYAALNAYDVDLRATLLKPSMVHSGKDRNVDRRSLRENALATAEVLANNVPVAVPGIVFLSGGMCEEEATLMLNEVSKLFQGELRPGSPKAPWALSFSYGRALQDSTVRAWNGDDANVKAAQTEFLNRCKANSEAALGVYTGWAAKQSHLQVMQQRGYPLQSKL